MSKSTKKNNIFKLEFKDNYQIINDNCINIMEKMGKDSINFLLTDIPYDEVNRKSNGLRKLDKWNADIITFDLKKFLELVYNITENNLVIFCWIWQVSEIYNFFKSKKGTVRQLVWTKTNPSPMNWKHIYLSAIENAIWFKKPWKKFNGYCDKNYFSFSSWRSKLHPTEKNHNLLKKLILDNTDEWDIVFDPCMGSWSHWLCALELWRKFIWIELDKEYFNLSTNRLKNDGKKVSE